jgi:hypothetical protein
MTMRPIFLASQLTQSIGKLLPLLTKPLVEMRIVCIPTAANVYAEAERGWQAEEMEALTKNGARL